VAALARTINVAGTAWKYLLTAAEQPRQFPRTLWMIAKGVNPGHYFKLNAPWIRQAGIRTVLDVGAHRGEFSSAVRALLPKAQIYAFEPLPDCCAEVARRFGTAGTLQAFPVAIGAVHDRITLWRSSYPKSSSVLPMAELHKDSFPWSAGNTPLTVEMRALDEYLEQLKLAEKVLLKIDVQGYEAQVLNGAKELLKRVAYVLLEVSFQPLYEGQGAFAEIHTFLQSAGFSYSGNLEQLLSPLDGSVLQADALFVRTGQ
jgi:FkbM family methyltransferase